MSNDETVLEYLRCRDGSSHLYHREGQELEFKEQFNFSGLAEYLKDFSAFANNRGGFLVFGVKDRPRIPQGLSETARDQFEKIDPEKITGFLLSIFSGDIRWEQSLVCLDDKHFGYFRIHEASTKPIIAKKDEGKDNTIKNGEVYYRYGGRTQKIQYAELQAIIERRVEQNNQQWLNLMGKIASTGPQNAAILDTERGLIDAHHSQTFVVDEALTEKLKFVREGEFVEKDGATTLKLVGDVVPVDKVEVIQKVQQNRLKIYPFTATQVAEAVKKGVPSVNRNSVWEAIKENKMKGNPDYSHYSFLNKAQEDSYQDTGNPGNASCIYNQNAIDFLLNVFRSQASGTE